MCEPVVFYMGSRDHTYVVADDPDGYLLFLTDESPAPEVVPYIFLIAPKTALMTLRR